MLESTSVDEKWVLHLYLDRWKTRSSRRDGDAMKYLAVLRRKAHVAVSLARSAARMARGAGVSATVRFVADASGKTLRERLGPSRPHKTNIVDQQYGTDTAKNLKLHELDISSPNYQHAVYYRATDLPILAEVLERLSLRHDNHTFVALGSGTAPVLLAAARYPLKKVIAVAFARELQDIAQAHVNLYPARLRRCPFEPVHEDAVEFSVPDRNVVLYHYERFEAPVTLQVSRRVGARHAARNLIAGCVWPRNRLVSCKALSDEQPFLTAIDERDH